jgi:hypothetical protein
VRSTCYLFNGFHLPVSLKILIREISFVRFEKRAVNYLAIVISDIHSAASSVLRFFGFSAFASTGAKNFPV